MIRDFLAFSGFSSSGYLSRQRTFAEQGLRVVPAARQDQLATAVFCGATEQPVLGEQSERCMYARGLFSRPLRIALGDEVEQSFEIAEGAPGYFDARHERARGRRGFLPRIRAAR